MATQAETVVMDKAEYRRRIGANRLGLWMFIFSEVFLFGGIAISRMVLWGSTRPELEQLPAFLLTSSLLLSSFFMNRAEIAMKYGDRRMFQIGVLMTMVMGTIFLLGVIFVEWPLSGLSPAENVYGAVLPDDRHACPACADRPRFPGDHLPEWAKRFAHPSKTLAGGSGSSLLAFCRRRMDFLLPGDLSDGCAHPLRRAAG
jgi:hypothetical protein